jgi:4-hydroxymandelate synthase
MRAIAHAEFRVEDVEKAADQLVSGYGFRVEEIHPPPRAGALLVNGGVRLLLAARPGPADADGYLTRHGDGCSAIAVACDDPAAAFARAVAHGARVVGELAVEVFDDFAVRFVAGDGATEDDVESGMFEAVDHVAVCVPYGTLEPVVAFCESALGLRRIFGELIEVGEQAMDSLVVQSETGTVTFTFLEPCPDREPGQIDAFLEAHGGPGVQHLALRTDDIAGAVRALGERDVEFLTTPGAYYEALGERIGDTGIPLPVLRELDILVDQDHGGQLFQIFSRSVHPRRTFFFELIERRGAGSFGTANIKALYAAIERDSVVVEH